MRIGLGSKPLPRGEGQSAAVADLLEGRAVIARIDQYRDVRYAPTPLLRRARMALEADLMPTLKVGFGLEKYSRASSSEQSDFSV